MFYSATQSKYKIVVCWKLILKKFGPNIQHIAVIDNILADALSRFPSTTTNQYDSGTSTYISQANHLFATIAE